MSPTKRGTRASKRKAEDETESADEVQQEVEAEQQEEGSEEGGEGDEGAAEEAVPEEAAPQEAAPQEESQPDNEEPPLKKSKVDDDAGENVEPEKSKESEEVEPEKSKEAEQKEFDSEIKKELDKYWKAVKDDPTDFTGWTYLLQYVDKKNIKDKGREAYDAFLTRYPYCYGYWKKYGDFETRNGTPQTVKATFNRGLKAIPLSVDLWIHYLNTIKQSADHKDDLAFIRLEYNNALQACGREWKSDKIWDHFIKFETEHKNTKGIYQLYGRIMSNSTQGLSTQFDKFREFIKATHPKELMDTSEFLLLRKEILSGLKGEKVPGGEEEGGLEPGSDLVPGEEGAEGTGSDEETSAMKEKLLFDMKKVFKETQEANIFRERFEEKIKRPYFHVKALERLQLTVWYDYLNEMKKMEKAGKVSETEVELLYERCLIACALYEEFWMNYISWLSGKEVTDEVDDEPKKKEIEERIRRVYVRACKSHLPDKVDIQLRWAAFEEVCGQYEAGADIYVNLEEKHPDLMSVKLKRINFERRRGNDTKVMELYEACIKSVENLSDNSFLADISIKYSRFLRLHLGKTDEAKAVIAKALEKKSKSVKLHLQMLDILLHTLPLNMVEITEFLEKAAGQEEFKASVRLVFAQRKVEILEDFGLDIREIQKAHDDYGELSKSLKPAMEEEEEPQPEGSNISTVYSSRDDKSRNGGTHTYAPMSNTPNYTAAHTQAHANYGYRYSQYPVGGYHPQGYGAPYGYH